MRKTLRILGSAAFLAGFTASAHADPVTAIYQISVVQRWDYQLQALEPFSSSFELTMSFDGSSSLSTSTDRTVREYGPVFFSAIPADLVVASQEGVSTVEHRTIQDQWWRSDGGYRRQSVASVLVTDAAFSTVFSGIVLVQPSQRVLSSPPVLSTASMLENLGMGNTISFLYTGLATTGSGAERMFLPNSYNYQGYATLLRYEIPGGEQPPAVPEPATILLLGSGLAGLALRRSRKR